MEHRFAALRFWEDKNISDKIYWYLCDLPVKEGERVLAPVGAHNRLQAAVIEKLISAEEEEAPYDLRLIKSTAAVLGARKLQGDGVLCLELGGMKYDSKHYTRFSVVLLSHQAPGRMEELKTYGVKKIFSPQDSFEEVYGQMARLCGCALLTGNGGAKIFQELEQLARGDVRPILSSGVSLETVRLLQEKIL